MERIFLHFEQKILSEQSRQAAQAAAQESTNGETVYGGYLPRMINELLQAIATAISEEFGREYTVYTDMPQQGQTKPCFWIEHLTFSVVPYLGSRRSNVCAFDIQYFSKTETQQDMCEVLIRLCDCLRMITSAQNNRFLGSNFNTKKENGVLHCLINYNFVTRDAAADEHAMSDVKIEQGLENTDGSSENEKRNSQ